MWRTRYRWVGGACSTIAWYEEMLQVREMVVVARGPFGNGTWVKLSWITRLRTDLKRVGIGLAVGFLAGDGLILHLMLYLPRAKGFVGSPQPLKAASTSLLWHLSTA